MYNYCQKLQVQTDGSHWKKTFSGHPFHRLCVWCVNVWCLYIRTCHRVEWSFTDEKNEEKIDNIWRPEKSSSEQTISPQNLSQKTEVNSRDFFLEPFFMFSQVDSENHHHFFLILKLLHSEQNKRQQKEPNYRNFRIVCTQSEDCNLEKTVAYAITFRVGDPCKFMIRSRLLNRLNF